MAKKGPDLTLGGGMADHNGYTYNGNGAISTRLRVAELKRAERKRKEEERKEREGSRSSRGIESLQGKRGRSGSYHDSTDPRNHH